MIAVCPYCLREHHTDVANENGECPTVSCCGETHCYLKADRLDPHVCMNEQCHDRNVYLQDMLAQALVRNQLLLDAVKKLLYSFRNQDFPRKDDVILINDVRQLLEDAKGWYGPKHYGSDDIYRDGAENQNVGRAGEGHSIPAGGAKGN